MRFIDASVFLYAFLKPRRRLPPQALELKERAKRIVRRVVEGGEEVVTTIVHVSEVANILESRLPLPKALAYIELILGLENIIVYDVDYQSYVEALGLAKRYGLGVNDALALVYMDRLGIREIYSFDSDFDRVEWVKRVTE